MNILITGSRSNIGYSLAKHLSLRGHIVYAGCKTLKEKVALEEKISQEKIIMFPIVLNLLDNDFSIIDNIDIDCLILHASISNGGSILEISNDRFNEVIDVNIKGNFRLLQKYLRYCYSNKRRGKVFITSSIASFYPLPYLSTYTSSKLYLYNMASTLRLELLYQNLDVSISLIIPGAYYTGFNNLMIDNKSMDEYIIKDKALTMTKYQKIMFCLLESTDYSDLVKESVKEIEKSNPKFIISRPFSQKLLTKIYILIKTFIV
ncbi:MAG TPA: SDR family NAD(P)-dependent oxidoreductase [Candidatus Onthousia faecipullorum]|uniref:SDR family NAD(P)-dependent oxidoreductase n=1 Tax=Candidatus Onthousia faecipullorum TaxID=2840887 RepID=A0A9D1KB59_9FIRM|nr:SDR family NAD(P)-dependent oxidoreductase [Candidatus Onthousia faecipullorum]